MVCTRKETLTKEIAEHKKQALAHKQAGQQEQARASLRAFKALQMELDQLNKEPVVSPTSTTTTSQASQVESSKTVKPESIVPSTTATDPTSAVSEQQQLQLQKETITARQQLEKRILECKLQAVAHKKAGRQVSEYN